MCLKFVVLFLAKCAGAMQISGRAKAPALFFCSAFVCMKAVKIYYHLLIEEATDVKLLAH